MATDTPTPDAPIKEPEKKGLKFPSAFTVLFLVLIIVWALSFVIKPGSYDYVQCDDDNPKPIAGSYHSIETDVSFKDKVYDLWLSPVNGLYGLQETQLGVEDPTAEQVLAAEKTCGEGVEAVAVDGPGQIGPYNSGSLFGSVQVFFFVLAIGAFITVTMRTGALDAGIGALTHKYKERGIVLVVLLMVVFSLGGTTYGMAEETLGFYALIVPIMIGLGFDRMVGVATIMVGAGVGTLASTVNPFATGVASDAAGIPLGDGIALRLLMYVVLTIVAILFVIRYAKKIQKDPSKSLVPHQAADDEIAEDEENPEPMTGQQKAVLWVFALTFIIMIFSVIPWSDFSEGLESITLGWYFPELAALFLVGSVIVGLIGKLGEEGMINGIIEGMGDFMGAAFIIALARGVTVIMNNSNITDTVLNGLEELLAGVTAGVFAVLIFIVNIPLAFLVPSSSGHATLAMPIMAPLADFAGVSRAMVVTGYQSASGWVNLFTPTSAIVMGGLTLSKVGYDKYIRFVWPLLAVLFVLICGFMLLGVAFPSLGGPV
jgi:uncharacterized ion transporter superfamily protein YfcC